MKRETHYLNSDLDLVSQQSLETLVAELERRGMVPLHLELHDDQRWHATLETGEQFTQPEPNMVALLAAIETLDPESRDQWAACATREFNIGYDCGDEPWAFTHGLTAPTLARMAAFDISLRITLYPAESATSEASEPTHDA